MSLRKVTGRLTAVNQELVLWCDGTQKVGISIRSVTGTVVLSFYASQDGINYNPITVGPYPSANPSAAGVLTAAATGNYELPSVNHKFVKVKMTTGSGPVSLVITSSTDGSYQEAFADATTGVSLSVIHPSTTSSAGVNTMTIPAQANRSINLTFLEVSQAGLGHGCNAQLRIWDSSVGNGVPLYSAYLTSPIGSVGTTTKFNMPEAADGTLGLLGTPGNAMVVQIINLGNVSAIINARVSYQ